MLSGGPFGKDKIMKRAVVTNRPTREELDQAKEDSKETQAKKEATEYFAN